MKTIQGQWKRGDNLWSFMAGGSRLGWVYRHPTTNTPSWTILASYGTGMGLGRRGTAGTIAAAKAAVLAALGIEKAPARRNPPSTTAQSMKANPSKRRRNVPSTTAQSMKANAKRNPFTPVAVAHVPGQRGEWLHADGTPRHRRNDNFTIYGPFQHGQPHPAAVAKQTELDRVLADYTARGAATRKPDAGLVAGLVAAMLAAGADGTETMLAGFARRHLKAARTAAKARPFYANPGSRWKGTSRDPFGRESLVRRVYGLGKCSWCGTKKKQYEYGTESDGGRTSWARGHYCGKSCFLDYYDGA